MRDVETTPDGDIPRSLPFRIYLWTVTLLGLRGPGSDLRVQL